MARSEAQKAADKRYRDAHKDDSVVWNTRFKPSEAAEIDEVIKQSGMSKADFIRWAIAEYKRKKLKK